MSKSLNIEPSCMPANCFDQALQPLCSHCWWRGCPDTPKFWTWVCNAQTFWQLYVIMQFIVFDRNMGLLKHFTVILVYSLYKSFIIISVKV